jgi:hypothetical protein
METPSRTRFVRQGSDTVSQYSIGATGTLTPLSPPTVSTGPQPISVTTTGTIE